MVISSHRTNEAKRLGRKCPIGRDAKARWNSVRSAEAIAFCAYLLAVASETTSICAPSSSTNNGAHVLCSSNTAARCARLKLGYCQV